MKRLLLLLFLSHALSPGSHVHQNSTGCEWDAKSCKVKDCNQYDEEDFIPLDLRTTVTRTTPKTQTAVVKDLWNMVKTMSEHIKIIHASSLEYLKYYMDYGISFLQRREHLSMVPLQGGLAIPSAPAFYHVQSFLGSLGLSSILSDPYTTMPVPNLKVSSFHGFHVLQRMSGCEWDEESGETKGFIGFGYDGEDFISLDFQTMTWITPTAQAVEIKRLWDTDIGRLAYIKNYYISECPKLIQKYMHHERKRKERPSVSLLQKTPSSPVSCHATGFYPERANLFWRKNGEEIHEDVKKGEILPNNDGTFQMSSELNISLVKHEDWRKYECVFQFYGVKEDIITTLNKTKIMTNWVSPPEFSVRHHVLVAVAAVVLLLVLGVLYCCWRKNL